MPSVVTLKKENMFVLCASLFVDTLGLHGVLSFEAFARTDWTLIQC
jgi:hypothetical protein